MASAIWTVLRKVSEAAEVLAVFVWYLFWLFLYFNQVSHAAHFSRARDNHLKCLFKIHAHFAFDSP